MMSKLNPNSNSFVPGLNPDSSSFTSARATKLPTPKDRDQNKKNTDNKVPTPKERDQNRPNVNKKVPTPKERAQNRPNVNKKEPTPKERAQNRPNVDKKVPTEKADKKPKVDIKLWTPKKKIKLSTAKGMSQNKKVQAQKERSNNRIEENTLQWLEESLEIRDVPRILKSMEVLKYPFYYDYLYIPSVFDKYITNKGLSDPEVRKQLPLILKDILSKKIINDDCWDNLVIKIFDSKDLIENKSIPGKITDFNRFNDIYKYGFTISNFDKYYLYMIEETMKDYPVDIEEAGYWMKKYKYKYTSLYSMDVRVFSMYAKNAKDFGSSELTQLLEFSMIDSFLNIDHILPLLKGKVDTISLQRCNNYMLLLDLMDLGYTFNTDFDLKDDLFENMDEYLLDISVYKQGDGFKEWRDGYNDLVKIMKYLDYPYHPLYQFNYRIFDLYLQKKGISDQGLYTDVPYIIANVIEGYEIIPWKRFLSKLSLCTFDFPSREIYLTKIRDLSKYLDIRKFGFIDSRFERAITNFQRVVRKQKPDLSTDIYSGIHLKSIDQIKYSSSDTSEESIILWNPQLIPEIVNKKLTNSLNYMEYYYPNVVHAVYGLDIDELYQQKVQFLKRELESLDEDERKKLTWVTKCHLRNKLDMFRSREYESLKFYEIGRGGGTLTLGDFGQKNELYTKYIDYDLLLMIKLLKYTKLSSARYGRKILTEFIKQDFNKLPLDSLKKWYIDIIIVDDLPTDITSVELNRFLRNDLDIGIIKKGKQIADFIRSYLIKHQLIVKHKGSNIYDPMIKYGTPPIVSLVRI